MNIDDLIHDAHATARDKGWWDEHLPFTPTPQTSDDLEAFTPDHTAVPNLSPSDVVAKLALISCEVSEAIEAVRNRQMRTSFEDGKPEGFAIELADIALRLADLCGGMEIDLAAAIATKMEYNRTRTARHGGKAL